MYTATERIYVNREFTAIVPEDTPEGAILLVPEGGTLTDEDAARWGLTGTDTKAVKGSKNKALRSPDATKADNTATP